MSDIANPPEIPHKPTTKWAETLGFLARHVRRQKSMTMGDVAKLWDCTVSYVSDVENGMETVTPERLVVLMTHVFVSDSESTKKVASALEYAAVQRQTRRECDIDWTRSETGHSNSSDLFNELSEYVEDLIRNSAFDIVRGDLRRVGGLIMAHLAHRYSLMPQPTKVHIAIDGNGKAAYFLSQKAAERHASERLNAVVETVDLSD